MFKNKKIKLFLILGVILFSPIGVVGCSTKNNTKSINASYIETFFENSNDVNGQFDIIENQADLVMLLKNDTPKKYNDSFFETNSLLVFKIVESSLKDKSEIDSYEINNKTITINVKEVESKDDNVTGCWWYILELSKAEINSFENIKIIKNNKEIISDNKIMLNSYLKQFDLGDEKDIFNGSEDDNFTTDSIIIVLKKTTTYPEFKLKYVNIKEATSFSYLSGKKPSLNDESQKNFRQIIEIKLNNVDKHRIIEIITEIEKLEFIKLASPNMIEVGNIVEDSLL